MAAAVEAGGFFLGSFGWALLGVTLPNSYWRVSTVEGNVITTSTLFENLWQSCATDSTGVYNCRDFPSMLGLTGYLQACRALMITALLFGFLAIVCSVVGMKCTKVANGNPAVKGKMAAAGGCMFILGGTRSARHCTWAGAGPCWPSSGAAASWGPAAPRPRRTRVSTTPSPRPAPVACGEGPTPAPAGNTARTPTSRGGDGGGGTHTHPKSPSPSPTLHRTPPPPAPG
ncbi:claudin-15 isoform X2 [Lepidochelys kempii]|uniref:claudin-15 isoform X2 n=1 Tax=Lepidochelys kempii TaxID=8472 RepID=UPI003C6FC96E